MGKEFLQTYWGVWVRSRLQPAYHRHCQILDRQTEATLLHGKLVEELVKSIISSVNIFRHLSTHYGHFMNFLFRLYHNFLKTFCAII